MISSNSYTKNTELEFYCHFPLPLPNRHHSWAIVIIYLSPSLLFPSIVRLAWGKGLSLLFLNSWCLSYYLAHSGSWTALFWYRENVISPAMIRCTPKSLAQSSSDLPGFETVDKGVEHWCHEEALLMLVNENWGSVLSVVDAALPRWWGAGKTQILRIGDRHRYAAISSFCLDSPALEQWPRSSCMKLRWRQRLLQMWRVQTPNP